MKSADLPGSACQSTLALLISHISCLILTLSQSLTLISCILFLGGEFEGKDFYPHRQIHLNCAVSSLCHTYYTYGTYDTYHTYYTYYTYYTYSLYLLTLLTYELYIYIYIYDYKVSYRTLGPKFERESKLATKPPFWTRTDISSRLFTINF